MTASGSPTVISEQLRAALGTRYRLDRVIGAGGMATVYLATDLKHDREVAIKVLRADIAAVLGVERFLAEVRITAKLDHPHILTLIDSGESAGVLYYVMPYVRGETLRTRLDRERQLGLDEALTIARQVAGALDHAHARGIVHRDIKPENILLHEGEAVLADFGIALAVREAGGGRLTETGISLGTPSYMSPEQATGDRAVDGRSDVYSLAAVLYEMIGGESPVTGATAQAMIAKLLTERPTSLRVVRDTVSQSLDAAVMRGLAKTPADRFKSAGEFVRAAEAGRTAAIPRAGPVRSHPLLIGLLAVLALGLAGYAAFGRKPAGLPFDGAIMTRVTNSSRAAAALPSPDGRQLAYADERCDAQGCRLDLMIRELDGEGVATIASEPRTGKIPMAWSPDSRWLAFLAIDLATQSYRGAYLVPQRGGTPRRVPGSVASFSGIDTIITVTGNSPEWWIRRSVVSTGALIDSVPHRVEGAVSVHVLSSPSGRWMMRNAVYPNPSDSSWMFIVDRAGAVTDSFLNRPSSSTPVWHGGREDAILQSHLLPGDGRPGSATARVVLRRMVDRRGRLEAAESLAIHDLSSSFNSASADGRLLYFVQERLGETSTWLATRRDLRSGFSLGRQLFPGDASVLALHSPRGGWVLAQRREQGAQGSFTFELEPFGGGARRVIASGVQGYQDIAFDPSDDSLAIATAEGEGRMILTIHPLQGGAPVRRGPYQGQSPDLEWLSDGRLASYQASRKLVRLFEPDGTHRDLTFPDSLGNILTTGRAPDIAELAILSDADGADGPILWVSRLDASTGRVIPIAKLPRLGARRGRLFWGSDGHIRFLTYDYLRRTSVITRVSVATGAVSEDAPLTFAPNPFVEFLSHDGLRAIVSSQSENFDIAVLRAPTR